MVGFSPGDRVTFIDPVTQHRRRDVVQRVGSGNVFLESGTRANPDSLRNIRTVRTNSGAVFGSTYLTTSDINAAAREQEMTSQASQCFAVTSSPLAEFLRNERPELVEHLQEYRKCLLTEQLDSERLEIELDYIPDDASTTASDTPIPTRTWSQHMHLGQSATN